MPSIRSSCPPPLVLCNCPEDGCDVRKMYEITWVSQRLISTGSVVDEEKSGEVVSVGLRKALKVRLKDCVVPGLHGS